MLIVSEASFSVGQLNGVSTQYGFLSGRLTFTFIAPVIDFDDSHYGMATVPVTLIPSSITGFSCDRAFPSSCWPIWNISVQGEGTVDLTAVDYFFAGGDYVQMGYSYTGVVTYTPEPSSFAMVGSGILGIVGLLRRTLVR